MGRGLIGVTTPFCGVTKAFDIAYSSEFAEIASMYSSLLTTDSLMTLSIYRSFPDMKMLEYWEWRRKSLVNWLAETRIQFIEKGEQI